MNDDNDLPFSGADPDGDIDEQEQYDESSMENDDELDDQEINEDDIGHLPDGFHIE